MGKELLAYLADIEAHRAVGRGVLLSGPAGVGKTYLACALLAAIPKPFTKRFYTLPTYLRMGLAQMKLKDQWSHGDDEAYKRYVLIERELLYIRNTIDFVVFDDVGMEHRTQSHWGEDEFQCAFRQRFDLSLPTIITTNNPPHEWGGTYGPSMQSFVMEACRVITVEGDDLRK